MRKVILSCLLLVYIFVFVGCSKDPLAEDTIEKIDSIGEVTLEDEELITELEQTYSEMTEKQKNQVNNYVDLKDARNELDELIAEKEQEEQEAILNVILNPPYSEAINLCSTIKQSLYNPDSFQLNNIEYVEAYEGYSLYNVDYSGENKLGGTVRTGLIATYREGSLDDIIEENPSSGYSSYHNYSYYEEAYFNLDDDVQTLDLNYITPYIG